MEKFNLYDTKLSTGDYPTGGHAAIGSFVTQCLNLGYRSFLQGKSKRDFTGKELCERFCTSWRRSHESVAKRAFSMGFDQAEIDEKFGGEEDV